MSNLQLLPFGRANRDFAILGGGASGCTVLFYIAQKLQNHQGPLNDLTLHLVDPKGFGSGGIAYGQTSPNHYLNSTRDEMSPWDTFEFHQWCIEQELGDNVQSFNFRADNGQFLSEKMQAVIQQLRAKGVNIVEHKSEGYPVRTGDNKFQIINESGKPIIHDLSLDDFVLAPGYGPNENFENLHQYQGDGYIHDIYNYGEVQKALNLKDHVKIAFAGTGPALYDFANDAKALGANIGLHAFSRAGRPLDIRDVTREPHEFKIPPNYDGRFDVSDAASLEKLIQADFDEARVSGQRTDRRVALDIMAHIRPYLVQMDPTVAALFTRSTFMSILKGKATPIPEFSQKRLLSFNPTLHQGHLNGNISRLKGGAFSIQNLDGEVIQADVIVNGTGHGRCNSKMAKHLIDNGLATSNDALCVLETDETGYRLEGSGIQILGPAVHFGTDGVESFAPPAERIANHFVSSLDQKSTNKNVALTWN